MQPLSIAILGAGIGGLASARFLAAQGHDITIIEKFETARPIGSGLVIQPVGLAVLDALGLDARQYATPIAKMYGTAGKRVALDVDYHSSAQGYGIHRGALFDLLWQGIPAKIVTGAHVAAVPLSGDRRLVEIDGRDPMGPYDLVIDASGAHSPVSPLRARALPFGALWSQVEWPKGSDLPYTQLTQRYARASRMAGILPIGRLPRSNARLASVFWSLPRADFARWQEDDFETWRSEAAAFWPAFAPFLAPLGRTDFTFAQYSYGTLLRPYGQGLALIGDAAHRASPQLGQGANMALLDAMALAEALRAYPTLDQALPAYAVARRRHLLAYQTLSAAFTPLFQSSGRVLPWLRDHVLGPMARIAPMPRVLTSLVSGDLVRPIS